MSNVSIQQVIDNLTTMDINSVPPWAILLIDSMKVVLSQLSNLNGIMEKINALESEVTISKNVSSNLANDNERLRNDLSVLQLKVDDIEQRNRNMCLLIHGVEETDGENTDDLVINVITENLEIDLTTDDIQRSHRLGIKSSQRTLRSTREKTRPIIFRFSSYRKRDEVYKNKRKLKGKKITITENLTKRRFLLYSEAMTRIGKNRIWTNEGRITTKVGDRFVTINSVADIDKIVGNSSSDPLL